HALPDFVYFDHSIHVAKGVACVECHGRVDQMPLTWRTSPLQMQWCLGCHRDPVPHLHAKQDVYAMPPPVVGAREAAALALNARLQATRRLTQCATRTPR